MLHTDNTATLTITSYYIRDMKKTVVKSALKKDWKVKVAQLKAYKKKYGNCNIPPGWQEDVSLARWVTNIRLHRRKLSKDLLAALTDIGFSFDMPSDWNTMFLQLESFYRKKGNSYVPASQKEYEKLFDWVERQRLSRSLLSKTQLEKLNSVDFDWVKSTDKDLLWQQRYGELAAFKKEHGHARVPATWKNQQLARWVARQRENEQAMAPWRKQMLNKLGFFWYRDMQKLDEQAWQTKYNQLKEFYKSHKHFKIPATNPEFHSLRIWVDKQRGSENKLSGNRKKLLDKIRFPWTRDVRAKKHSDWLVMYEKLVSYYKKYGDTLVSNHSRKHATLGTWVLRQRKGWEKLDKQQQLLLRKIKFQTSEDIQERKREQWMRMFMDLKRYKAKNGNCRVPSYYDKDPVLGRWVETQRLNENNLVEWKRKLLNAVGFEWSSDLALSSMHQWHKMYHQLERFYKRYGHSSVPYGWEKNKQLANWVWYQREPKTPLSKEKKTLLKKLSFAFNARPVKSRKRNSRGQFVNEV